MLWTLMWLTTRLTEVPQNVHLGHGVTGIVISFFCLTRITLQIAYSYSALSINTALQV